MIASEKQIKLQQLNFPAAWQTVIFRNYGMVRNERIAKVLGCDEQTVILEANRLGLKDIVYNPVWEKKGHITIIRNNWFLLNYEQLLQLLDFTPERLEFSLKEDDFLYVKLGYDKPICPTVVYTPLTNEQLEQTNLIGQFIQGLGGDEGKPFDFYSDNIVLEKTDSENNHTLFIHGYATPCGDVFMMDSSEYFSDEVLSQYQSFGINAIWQHATLSNLSYYPFYEPLCEGYKQRRKNLNNLIARCKKFGIKIILYINEPRCLDLDKFGDNKHLLGEIEGNAGALCISNKEVQDYLYNAVYDLLKDCPDLGGLKTITMSENLTHCKSRLLGDQQTTCEKCKDIPAPQLASLVNNIVMKAIKDSGAKTELIANLWGWSSSRGWTKEMIEQGISLLDKDVSVLRVSEIGMEIEKFGEQGKVGEYSISQVGPSELAKSDLLYAKNTGHKTYAKIQVNNSWECSLVPMIPVFDLVYEHLQNLKDVGVSDYQLSWTLGGYPSITLDLVKCFSQGVSLDEWYKMQFNENAQKVHNAISLLCDSFRNYPFSVDVLYFSPKNMSYANMWQLDAEQKQSSMVGYSFDDYEKWIKPYSLKTYLKCFKTLLSGWKKGLDILEGMTADKKISKLYTYAKAVYVIFESDYNQTLFSFYKRDIQNNKQNLLDVIDSSIKGVYQLIELQKQDATIGFEASNQYNVNIRQLKEKLLNLDIIKGSITTSG